MSRRHPLWVIRARRRSPGAADHTRATKWVPVGLRTGILPEVLSSESPLLYLTDEAPDAAAGPARMDIVELLTRGYRSLGFGASSDVLRLFDQRIEGDTVRWVVVEHVAERPRDGHARGRRPRPAGQHPAQHWEVAGVDTRSWRRHGGTIVVTGHIRVRPRGGWDVLPVPFAHIWKVAGDKVVSVRSYLDGIEVRRPRRPR